jgi:REP element-mobilizing transposase RayT
VVLTVIKKMWNDTDTALAYLVTFRCYGTWLHGDERGSVDRAHNQFGTPYMLADERQRRRGAQTLKSEPVFLDASRRECVESAIRETCLLRGWRLRALSVRTNHVHTVVSIGTTPPERALNAFKANATRHLRQRGQWNERHSPWVDKGSRRFLWNERSIERAVEYVLNGQGEELPEFD